MNRSIRQLPAAGPSWPLVAAWLYVNLRLKDFLDGLVALEEVLVCRRRPP